MSASETDEERQVTMSRTPSKPDKEPRRPMIGSSSTWGKAQLDRFQVQVPTTDARKEMIPDDKWSILVLLTNTLSVHTIFLSFSVLFILMT